MLMWPSVDLCLTALVYEDTFLVPEGPAHKQKRVLIYINGSVPDLCRSGGLFRRRRKHLKHAETLINLPLLRRLLQERSQTADIVPAPDAPGGPPRLRADLPPGPCGPARSGAFHHPQPGLCCAVWSEQHLSRRNVRSGKTAP